MAGKDALAHGAQRLLSDEYGDRVGMDAALGGTGASLQRELKTLQKECREIAVVGNATTTLLLSCVEKGLGFEAALDEARRRGLLESDPGDDLDGSDAAAKLAAVVRAVFLEDVDPGAIEKQHFRDLDPGRIRERSARGTTTRLVGRALRGGPLRVAYEEVDAGSPLAVPPDRLAYLYPLGGGAVRVFVGSGVGPEATARALWQDALRLASAKGGAR
jgi:homoserine dehydrogenase